MLYRIVIIFLAFSFSSYNAADIPDAVKVEADSISKAGSIAAGYSELSKAEVPIDAIVARFSGLGDEVTAAARLWGEDAELRDSPPAFRRFLFFDYLSRGKTVIAGASNPDDLLINADAAVDVIFENPALAASAKKMMDDKIQEPTHIKVNGFLLGGYPMIPSAEKAAKCIACHASDEVGVPYPEGEKILGYTFVALPLVTSKQ